MGNSRITEDVQELHLPSFLTTLSSPVLTHAEV